MLLTFVSSESAILGSGNGGDGAREANETLTAAKLHVARIGRGPVDHIFFLDNGNDGRPRYICCPVGSASQLPTSGFGRLSLALHRMR